MMDNENEPSPTNEFQDLDLDTVSSDDFTYSNLDELLSWLNVPPLLPPSPLLQTSIQYAGLPRSVVVQSPLRPVAGPSSLLDISLQYAELPLSVDVTSPLQQVVVPSQLLEPSIEYPEHWYENPSMDVVNNPYELQMLMEPPKKSDWVYYEKTNKVFIKPNTVMTTTFSFKPNDSSNLILRAMIVNTNPDHMRVPIKRCANHRSSNNTADVQDVPPAHILKCYHRRAVYLGKEDSESFGDRLSVVVPLKRSIASESIQWKFLCKNVCAEGIKRKSAAVVFTLENESFEILGKVIMPFKVCGAPKRDMKTEVGPKNPRKRKSTTVLNDEKPSKMVCSTERQSFVIMLTLPDRESVQHAVECANNRVAGVMVRDQNTSPDYYHGMMNKNTQQVLQPSHSDHK